MATMYPVAGCKMFIGGAPMARANDLTATDFDAVVWVQIKGWTSMGSTGGQWNETSSEQLDEQEVIYQKSTHTRSMMENSFDVIPNDPGQIKMIEAKASKHAYPVQIVYNDAPETGVAPAPGERLFVGLFMSDARSGGGASDSRRMSASIRPVSNFVDVPASTGA